MIQFLYYLLFAVAGILVGSCLSPIIVKLQRGSIFDKSRSYCPHCGKELSFMELNNITCFFFLGNRCKRCEKRLPMRYPFTDFLNFVAYLVIFAVIYNTKLNIVYALILCILFSTLIVASYVEIDTRKIPRSVLLFIAALSLLSFCFITADDILWWSKFVSALILTGLFIVLSLFFRGNIGPDDIKLIFLLGLFFDYPVMMFAALIAIIFTILFNLIILIRRKSFRRNQILFTPFLSVALFIAELSYQYIFPLIQSLIYT